MTKNISIQFILQELANNAEDRERFNNVNEDLYLVCHKEIGINLMLQASVSDPSSDVAWVGFESIYYIDEDENEIEYNFQYYSPMIKEVFIRTALSRINGEAVLGALEREYTDYADTEQQCFEITNLRIDGDIQSSIEIKQSITNKLYQAFDTPFRNGEGLEKALTALDQYFREEGGIIKLNVK